MSTIAKETLATEQNITLAKKLSNTVWIVTLAVLGLVVFMHERSFDLPNGWDFSVLVPFYSLMNALTAVVLVIGMVMIKQKKYKAHQNAMTTALGLSLLFLLAYVAYHMTNDPTKFGDANKDGILQEAERLAIGSMATIYYIILVSHIVLAAVSFPFILITFIRSYTKQFAKHKKMARWVFPIWLYVAITGPIVYLMLMPYY